MSKDRILAILNKPVGRGSNRYWRAFEFSSNANQSDVEAFMCSIHIDKYFLHMRSQLERVRPYKGSPFACSQYYLTSKEYGRIYVYANPVGFTWERRKEDGRMVKCRLFKVR